MLTFLMLKKIVKLITEKVLLEGLKLGHALILNIPNVNESKIKELKFVNKEKLYGKIL